MQTLNQNQLTYESYLKIPEILAQQNLLSAHHDEMLFIMIHQVYELWFKLTLHELGEVMRCFDNDEIQRASKVLNRIITIQKVLVTQIDVLETMTPVEFAEFRDLLRPASGFQSVQFREVEFLSGLKNPMFLKMLESIPEAHARLARRMDQPTLYDHFLRLLARQGFDIGEEVLSRDVSVSYEANEKVLNAIHAIYKDIAQYHDLYMLCEVLMSYDENFSLWRFRHVKMVERTIGTKTGTGGSSGAEYLKSTLTGRFFPELWDVRSLIGSY